VTARGTIHHVELQAVDLDAAIGPWGWLLTTLGYAEHQRWSGGASWMLGDAYVVVARAGARTPHDRRGGGLNHLALHAGSRADVDAVWRAAERHGWHRLSDARYDWRLDGDAESAFLESSERLKIELVAAGTRDASRHLSIVIRRDPATVAAFARDPGHLPEWAAGLAQGGLRHDGDALVVDSPMGEVRVRFAPANAFGVLDHDVTLPDGSTVHNPLRVLAHPHGAEVVFTLRSLEGVTADAFEADARAVTADLERLRALLER